MREGDAKLPNGYMPSKNYGQTWVTSSPVVFGISYREGERNQEKNKRKLRKGKKNESM